VADLSPDSGRWIEEQRRPLKTILFNEKGYVTKELLYDPEGSLSQVGSMEYDARGNKTKVLFRNPRGAVLSSRRYKYDEAGRLLECVSTEARGPVSRERCSPLYDRSGNRVEEVWCYEDGTASRKYVYQYYPAGEIARQMKYKYADDGSIEEKWLSIYDEKGNIVQTVCYDEQGQTIAGPTTYKYDDDGVEIEGATFSLTGNLYSTTSYFYDFNTQRNWIRRLEIFKTVESRFETRVITYRGLEHY
jgi:YD repeat-containing protein